MPKPRNVDRGFFDDPDVARLARDERLLLVGMIATCADDEGRLMADAGYLRKTVFGYDDDVSKEDVQHWRDNIVSKCRNIKQYEVDEQLYIWFVNWKEYQGIRYVVASKLPAYAATSDTFLPIIKNSGNLPQSSVNYRSRDTHLRAGSVGLGRVNVGLGRVALKKEKEAVASDTPPTPKLNKQTSFPAEFTISQEDREWAKEHVPRLDLKYATTEWATSMRANTTKYKYTDWHLAWRGAMTRALKWDDGGNGARYTNVTKPTPPALREL